jgi:hypothetical protein
MKTFPEFLENLAQKQRQPERRQRRDEWIAAVSRLFERLRAWLTESDPARWLDVIPLEIERTEPSLGRYPIQSLQIGVGDVSVQVVPIGRDALGVVHDKEHGELRAQGRVDISDGVRKYILYRTLHDGQEQWYVLDEDFRAAPLDRGRLEAILQDLLS